MTRKRHLRPLTPSTPAVPDCCCSKCSVPYWCNPPFLIFDIRALWRSVLSARAPECQKLKMVGYTSMAKCKALMGSAVKELRRDRKLLEQITRHNLRRAVEYFQSTCINDGQGCQESETIWRQGIRRHQTPPLIARIATRPTTAKRGVIHKTGST